MPAFAHCDPYALLAPTERCEAPFRYFLSVTCLTRAAETSLLEWFDEGAPWRLVETDFYEQFEFDMRDADLPKALLPLIAPDSLHRLRQNMEKALGASLAPDVQVVAHRLEPGQRIAIHNDMRLGGETHRLTIQVNRGLNDSDGGFFMLFNSEDASDIHRILRPTSGSAIGFAIGPTSHHAVSRLHGGIRYTLVFSFHASRQN